MALGKGASSPGPLEPPPVMRMARQARQRATATVRSLPDELMVEIFAYVDAPTLVTLSEVCQDFRRLAAEQVRLVVGGRVLQPGCDCNGSVLLCRLFGCTLSPLHHVVVAIKYRVCGGRSVLTRALEHRTPATGFVAMPTTTAVRGLRKLIVCCWGWEGVRVCVIVGCLTSLSPPQPRAGRNAG